MLDTCSKSPSPQRTDAAPSLGAIRFSAMGLLARREHSRLELQQKLSKRFGNPKMLQEALSDLAEEGLQSDSRFAESFINSRIRRGQGPVRIRNDLRTRGVSNEIVLAALDMDTESWVKVAREVVERKYGVTVLSVKDKAKQFRFLQYRGFTGDQINLAIKASSAIEL